MLQIPYHGYRKNIALCIIVISTVWWTWILTDITLNLQDKLFVSGLDNWRSTKIPNWLNLEIIYANELWQEGSAWQQYFWLMTHTVFKYRDQICLIVFIICKDNYRNHAITRFQKNKIFCLSSCFSGLSFDADYRINHNM